MNIYYTINIIKVKRIYISNNTINNNINQSITNIFNNYK